MGLDRIEFFLQAIEENDQQFAWVHAMLNGPLGGFPWEGPMAKGIPASQLRSMTWIFPSRGPPLHLVEAVGLA